MADYIEKNDGEMKEHFTLHRERLDTLKSEIERDLQVYNTKETLKGYMNDLFDNYAAINLKLGSISNSFSDRDEYYAPPTVSPRLQELNLLATYIELKMRLLNDIYQDLYGEPYSN